MLHDITLTIEQGEYVSIIGHSGCGKSTLLNIVAGLAALHHRRRAAGEPRGERAGPGPRGRVPEPLAAAVAHRLRQRRDRGEQGVRRQEVARRAPRLGDAQSRSRADGARQGQAPGRDLRRHEAARRPRARAVDGAEGAAARRAVRRARCAHPRAPAGLGDGDPRQARQHRADDHARRRRGGAAVRPHRDDDQRPVGAASARCSTCRSRGRASGSRSRPTRPT